MHMRRNSTSIFQKIMGKTPLGNQKLKLKIENQQTWRNLNKYLDEQRRSGANRI